MAVDMQTYMVRINDYGRVVYIDILIDCSRMYMQHLILVERVPLLVKRAPLLVKRASILVNIFYFSAKITYIYLKSKCLQDPWMLQSPRIGPDIDTQPSLFLNSWINKVNRRDSQLQHCAAH